MAAALRSLRSRVATALREAPASTDAGAQGDAGGWTTAARDAVCAALAVPSFQAAQDVINALAMSECAYTAHEIGPPAAAAALASLKAAFPPGLLTVAALQPSLPSVRHRYVLGAAPDALIVGFMGTSDARDAVADANLLQEALWGDDGGGAAPAVHRGFAARARAVPVDLLAALAAERGARLVMTGHSLGGAVAQLAALRLLKRGGAQAGALPSCIAFAAPALGNSALAADVAARGWESRFYNLSFDDDAVPRVLADVDAARPPKASTATSAHAVVSHAPFVADESSGAVSVETAAADPTTQRSDSGRWAWPAALLPPAAAAWWSTATAAGADAARSAARLVPSYAHFGQNVTPALPVREGPAAAASPTEPALATRLAALAASLAPDAKLPTIYTLNAHRVSTYRNRLAAIVAAAAGDGAPPRQAKTAAGDAARFLSTSLAPRLHPAAAVAVMPLLPPPEPTAPMLSSLAPASAWASVRRAADAVAARARGAVAGADLPPAPASVPLAVAVDGGGLATARSARVSAPGPAWCGATITERPPLTGGPATAGRAAVVARVPPASLAAAAASGDAVGLWLRSDFDEAVVDVSTLLPTVWAVTADGEASVSLTGGARATGATAATLGAPLARAATIINAVSVVDAAAVAGDRPAAQAAAVATVLGGGPRWAATLAALPRAAAVWLPARAAGARAGARAAAALPAVRAGVRVPTVVAVVHALPPSPGSLAELAAAAAAAGAIVVPLLAVGRADVAAAAAAAYGQPPLGTVAPPVRLPPGAGARGLVDAVLPALERAQAAAGPRSRL